METLTVGLVLICGLSLLFNFVICGRFIDLIEDMRKREYRKNNTKN